MRNLVTIGVHFDVFFEGMPVARGKGNLSLLLLPVALILEQQALL